MSVTLNENSLGKLAEEGSATRTTATTAPAETPTNSKGVIILVLGVAIVLLVGIAYVIVRDARKVAPVSDGQLGEAGPARDSAARLRRRRAKAKAARRQRKRNR
jgi:hypothetical protein